MTLFYFMHSLKNLVDRKKKLAETKKRMDEDIEELKAGHEVSVHQSKFFY